MVADGREHHLAGAAGESLHDALAGGGGFDFQLAPVIGALQQLDEIDEPRLVDHQFCIKPLMAIGACGDGQIVYGGELLDRDPDIIVPGERAVITRAL